MLVFDRKSGTLIREVQAQNPERPRAARPKKNRPLHQRNPSEYVAEQVKRGVRFMHVRDAGSSGGRERIHTIAYTYDPNTGLTIFGKSVYTAPTEDDRRVMNQLQLRWSAFCRKAHNVTAAVRRERRPQFLQLPTGLKNKELLPLLFRKTKPIQASSGAKRAKTL